MDKRRIGNDIPITWKVLTNGERVSLEGRDLIVKCEDAFGHQVPVEWLVTGYEVAATIRGKNQRSTGLLTLTLVENDGKDDQRTVDVRLVELVAHSWQVENPSAGEAILITASLETNISVTEIIRLRAIAEAEAGRVSAEQQRAAAECERQEAEQARATAESDRTSAETARQDAETGRASAEQARVTAESARASAETTRQDAETGRVSAEQTRATAESARATAETARKNAETNRASAEQARATAENARATAETARQDAETRRVSAEQERVTAESARATAETARKNAETGRASAEQSRVTAESARASAETARQDAETGRVSAEQARATAEGARATAETARKNAETERASAEQARATAEGARANAETARRSTYEQLKEEMEETLEAAAAAVIWTEAHDLTPEQQEAARNNIGAAKASDVTDLAARVADLEFEQGDYYVEAYTPETTDVTPVHAYGNKALLKQFDFILLDTTRNTGTVTQKVGVLKRNNLLRFQDGHWAPAVGITAEQAADAQLELFAISGGAYVQYCAAGAYDAEAYVEHVLRPWYAGTLEDYDSPRLYKSDGEGGYTEAHALCPWETTETKYTIGLGAQHKMYVLDNVRGDSGKIWKGLFLDKTGWDGIDLTQFALEPTAISPCPVCTVNDGGVHKTRSFFYLYDGDTNCKGAKGIADKMNMFYPGNRTYPRTTDMHQVSNMNWARANNADNQSPLPFAEGGFFALDAFVIAQELLYSRRNPFRASQFGSGISSNDACSSETTWRRNGGIRFRKSDAVNPDYAPFSSNTPFYYNATGSRTDWSNTLNQYAPKEQCMESQIVASFIAEFGIAATTDEANPHYFEVYGGKYYWMAVADAAAIEEGYMNVRVYRELEADGTSWYDADGNTVEYDIAVILRMSLMGGANLSGDIFAYWGGGCEVVGTCGANTANGTTGHVMDGYLQPDQSKWLHETGISKNDLGVFEFESDYMHMNTWLNLGNGYTIQRGAYLPNRIRGGASSVNQGECYYEYGAKYWSATVNQRVRVALRFRGNANSASCSPRTWHAYYSASSATRYSGGSAQARFE